MIFQPVYSSSGSRWLEPVATARGARQDPPWAGGIPISGRLALTHAPSDQDQVHTPIHPTGMWVGCMWKPEALEETYAGMGSSG